MESRAFIKHAAKLINKIENTTNPMMNHVQQYNYKEAVQKEINQLFAGLHNPTLPSAHRLRDTAHEFGYSVDSRVLIRLAQFG